MRLKAALTVTARGSGRDRENDRKKRRRRGEARRERDEGGTAERPGYDEDGVVFAGGRARAQELAAARMAARAACEAVAGAVRCAGGAGRPCRGGEAGGGRAAGATGAPGAVAGCGAGRRPRLPGRRQRLLLARAAVGVRRASLQQGAGVPRAEVRTRDSPLARRLRVGAGPFASRPRYSEGERTPFFQTFDELSQNILYFSERFRSLDNKLKSNPISLEEVRTSVGRCRQRVYIRMFVFLSRMFILFQMLLMTIYS